MEETKWDMGQRPTRYYLREPAICQPGSVVHLLQNIIWFDPHKDPPFHRERIYDTHKIQLDTSNNNQVKIHPQIRLTL